MSYETVAAITQVTALILFIVLFAMVLAYTFWPGSGARFERAARLPLESDDGHQEDQ